jgi:hypothetical protein
MYYHGGLINGSLSLKPPDVLPAFQLGGLGRPEYQKYFFAPRTVMAFVVDSCRYGGFHKVN